MLFMYVSLEIMSLGLCLKNSSRVVLAVQCNHAMLLLHRKRMNLRKRL